MRRVNVRKRGKFIKLKFKKTRRLDIAENNAERNIA